jgi:prepilin-type N-terminal cleavage/methylation domain-containing protein/prepilin-type processing-associated H-X9-DG protein
MSRRAFTLIELLVVIGIIGVLLGLLLPAVQKVRAAASRILCSNNMRQLALAAHHYHDRNGSFPPGFFRAPGPMRQVSVFTLFVELLAYIEQDNLERRWDYQRYGNNRGPYPTAPAAQVVDIFVCPADALPRPAIFRNEPSDPPEHWGLTSYGGNAGIRSTGWPTRDGIFYEGSAVRLEDITDGASTTLFFGERNHFDPNYDRLCPRDPIGSNGWWAYPGTADVLLSAAVSINYQVPASAVDCEKVKADRLSAFGSRHGEGANFALADGSVRFLPSVTSLTLLRHLSTRAGGEALEDF